MSKAVQATPPTNTPIPRASQIDYGTLFNNDSYPAFVLDAKLLIRKDFTLPDTQIGREEDLDNLRRMSKGAGFHWAIKEITVSRKGTEYSTKFYVALDSSEQMAYRAKFPNEGQPCDHHHVNIREKVVITGRSI